MSDSNKDIAQQCEYMPSYNIPKWESSSIPYAPECHKIKCSKRRKMAVKTWNLQPMLHKCNELLYMNQEQEQRKSMPLHHLMFDED